MWVCITQGYYICPSGPLQHCPCGMVREKEYLHPLGEIVHEHQNIAIPSSQKGESTNYVYSYSLHEFSSSKADHGSSGFVPHWGFGQQTSIAGLAVYTGAWGSLYTLLSIQKCAPVGESWSSTKAKVRYGCRSASPKGTITVHLVLFLSGVEKTSNVSVLCTHWQWYPRQGEPPRRTQQTIWDLVA